VVEHDVEMALFITLSAAHYHWDSLQRHMPRYSEWRDATGAVRIRIARTNPVDNPHIAAYHFHRRTQLFRDLVLGPLKRSQELELRRQALQDLLDEDMLRMYGSNWCSMA